MCWERWLYACSPGHELSVECIAVRWGWDQGLGNHLWISKWKSFQILVYLTFLQEKVVLNHRNCTKKQKQTKKNHAYARSEVTGFVPKENRGWGCFYIHLWYGKRSFLAFKSTFKIKPSYLFWMWNILIGRRSFIHLRRCFILICKILILSVK